MEHRAHGHLQAVAICIAGESRDFWARVIHENIFHMMVAPIRDDADVFVGMSVASEANATSLQRLAYLRFGAIAINLRRQWDPGEKQLTAVTSATVCLPLIQAREASRGVEYRWVMRLRGDIMYHVRIPPLASFPRGHGTKSLVYTESCGTGGGPLGMEMPEGGICAAWHYPRRGKFSCVKDTWALMTRSAASTYFSLTILEAVEKGWRRESCATTSHECLLGCALHKHNVGVHWVLLPRLLVRHVDTRGEVVTTVANSNEVPDWANFTAMGSNTLWSVTNGSALPLIEFGEDCEKWLDVEILDNISKRSKKTCLHNSSQLRGGSGHSRRR